MSKRNRGNRGNRSKYRPVDIERAAVTAAFNFKQLKQICEMPESAFGAAFEMDKFVIATRATDNFYFYRDNGASILAVAHLDTVVSPAQRAAYLSDSPDGPVVFSGALDDRLGAYIILDMLPALGINVDILLTVGEESGRTTAAYFELGDVAPIDKEYNWVIEFDRGGTDVVMYQYEDADSVALVENSGAIVGNGIFSDIGCLDQLGVKCFNWGVGYQDYHGPRSHAFLNDTFEMVAAFVRFHSANADMYMPHDEDSIITSAIRSYSELWGGSDYSYRPAANSAAVFTDEIPLPEWRPVGRPVDRSETFVKDVEPRHIWGGHANF